MEDPRPKSGAAGAGDTFAARLRELRRAAGLTQEELASRAGLSPNAVSALERGNRRRPYPHTVRALAEALALTKNERAALLAAVPGRGEDETRASEPARRSVPPTALSHPATPLLGRYRELEEVAALLARPGARLVTLTGVGGVGKTRLALEAARTSLAADRFPDGTAVVELAPLEDPALVASAALQSLGAAEWEGRTPGEALVDHLRDKRLLLVLDNFEHLLDAAPEVASLVGACPGLSVLVSSRAPLRVRGEHEYAVPPLALPASTRSPSEDEVLASPAGTLFVERAQATSPGFRLTSENAPSVAAICWRLAGLPLALELAAAKARFLDPAALLSRLDEALTGAWARDLPERQRTMRATLDWSYDLLEASEQRLFRRLSVFSGGFTLEAAEAVGTSGDDGGEGVLSLLGALVEQSLILAEPAPVGSGTRYGMLEPVRQYAREKLEQGAELGDAARRHAGFFLELAERVAPRLWGSEQGGWLEELEQESGNLRAAISWSLGSGEAVDAARLCWALWLFWWVRGHHREGRRWSEAALEGEPPLAWRARVLPVAAAMFYAQNDHESAEERWREGLDLSMREGDALAEGYARSGLGLARMARGDHEAAAESFGEALPLLEGRGDPLISLVHVWLGTSSLLRGDAVRAEREIEEGLRSARTRGDTLCTYVALYNLAQLSLVRGDLVLAADALEEGVELSGHNKDRANLAHFLEALSAVAALRGEAKRSAVLIGASEGSLREVGAPVYNFYSPDPSLVERASSEAREALGDAGFEDLRGLGRGMTFDEAVGHALGAG